MKPQRYGSHSNCTTCTYIKSKDITTQGRNQICMKELHDWHLENYASLKLHSHRASWFCSVSVCQEDLSSWAWQNLNLPCTEALTWEEGDGTFTCCITLALKMLWIKQLLLINWNLQPEGVITTKALWKKIIVHSPDYSQIMWMSFSQFEQEWKVVCTWLEIFKSSICSIFYSPWNDLIK